MLPCARALVTGASRGIGEALARSLAAGGAEVTLVGREAKTLAPVAEAIRQRGGRARPLPLDVREGAHTVAALRSTPRYAGQQLGAGAAPNIPHPEACSGPGLGVERPS